MTGPKEYYDYTYHYEEDITTGLDYKRLRVFFRSIPFDSIDDYIDIGCGAGLALDYCHRRGLRSTGFDISLRAIKTARSILPSAVSLLVADGERLPFKNQSFGFASSFGTIEHFPSPQQGLQEISRVCRKNSLLLLIVPNSFWFLNKTKIYKGTEQPQEMLATLGEWARLFRSSGLEILNITRDIGPKILKNRSVAGIIKRTLLKVLLMLPLEFAYQFVFLCRVK